MTGGSARQPLLGDAALGDVAARLEAAVGPQEVVDAWATVELDRAQEEVTLALGHLGSPNVEVLPDARLLGARCRMLRFGEQTRILLLEPSIEGRLAAGLARHGEGYLARYLLVDGGAAERARRARFTISSEGRGPLGAERLIVDGPRSGPFLLLAGLH